MVLEPLEARHAELLYAPLQDPAIYRFIPGDAPASVEHLRERYLLTSRGPSGPGERWWNWAVRLRTEAAPAIGTVEISIIDGGAQALLAYVFAPASWGKGFACEACAAALAHLRSATHLTRIEAFIDSCNARSIALVERLGFTREGYVENADYFKGRPSHEYRYGLELAKR